MIVLDTNVVIAGLKRGRPFLPPDEETVLSVISEIELLVFPSDDKSQQDAIRDFLSTVYVVGITDSIKQKTIWVRRTHRLKLPDAIIAATALSMNASLYSFDRGFQRIPELIVNEPTPPE